MSAAKFFPLLALLFVGGCTMIQQARAPELDAERRLERGLGALDAGLYAEAFDDLAWVYSRCAGYSASHQALAGLAALELDPRNRAGREAVGSELLGRLVRHPGPPEWTRPLSTTSYLMALALGAPPAPADGIGAPVGANDSAVTGAPAAAAAGGADTTAAAHAPAGAPAAISVAPSRAPAMPVMSERQEPVYGCGRRVPSGDWLAPELPTLPGPSVVELLARAEQESTAMASRSDSLAQQLAATRQQLAETQAELERVRKTLRP